MRNGVRLAARLVDEVTVAGDRRWRPVMVTLTYREVGQWRPKHVSAFIDAMRKWAARRRVELPYVWVAELQKRGAVHYHMVVWVPRHLMLPKPDKRGWWPHGMTQVVAALKPVAYMTKYASKGSEARGLPRGLRLWGCGGLGGLARTWRHWLMLPAWLRREIECGEGASRVRGAGWTSRRTGEVFRSPYVRGRLVRVQSRYVGVVMSCRAEGGV